MIDPAAAARNFERMADIGARGVYGWYEALDYTRDAACRRGRRSLSSAPTWPITRQ